MDELKKQLADMCRKKLRYYDVVDERRETIDYDMVIDVLFSWLSDMIENICLNRGR